MILYNKRIKLVQQPTDTTCVSACLSMVLGKDVQQIINEFHDRYLQDPTYIEKYLEEKNINVNYYRTIDSEILFGHVYFSVVPSLNKIATLHQIILDTRDGLVVFDPNKGRVGKKYYSYDEDDDPMSVGFNGRIMDFDFIDLRYFGQLDD